MLIERPGFIPIWVYVANNMRIAKKIEEGKRGGGFSGLMPQGKPRFHNKGFIIDPIFA
jgi:hypothetical protein